MTRTQPRALPLGTADSGTVLDIVVGSQTDAPTHLIVGGAGTGKSSLANHIGVAALALHQMRVGLAHDCCATLLDPEELALELDGIDTRDTAVKALWDLLYVPSRHEDAAPRLLVVDDADLVSSDVLKWPVRTGRSVGVGLIATSSHPTAIDDISVGTATTVTYLGGCSGDALDQLAITFGVAHDDITAVSEAPDRGLHMDRNRNVTGVSLPQLDVTV